MALWSPALLIPIAALLVSSSYIYIKYKRSNSPILPVNWPIVGVVPALVANLNNLHNFFTAGLAASTCNYKVLHGPVGMRAQYFITSDPQNVRHIFTSNQANYPKGEKFAENFDIMKGSLFTVDGESCRRHRAKLSILSNPRMLASITNFCRDKVEKGLLPFLAHMANTGTPFDMQQLNTRYAFDVAAKPVFGLDPGLLSLDMPPVHVTDAMDTVMEVPMFRDAMPALLWKLMRRLNIGPEKRLAAAQAVLRGFVVKMMETRKNRRSVGQEDVDEAAAASLDILSSYINDPNYRDDDEVVQASLISYLVAGRDTVGAALSWLFYNISRNPSVLSRIRKELVPIASRKAAAAAACKEPNATVTFEPEETKELVYLQAVVLETLRLYPPVPLVLKTVLRDDTLPSGDEVGAGATILISLYAMARMEPVWGSDCQEYRPERWLSDDGSKLQYVPSHKFLTFSSGPRMCLGKDIGIMHVKTAAANVLWNFDMELLEGHAVEPEFSTILQMKNGLMMKVKKRANEPL